MKKKIFCIALALMIAAVSLAAAGIFLRLGLIARNEGLIAEEQTRLSVEIARRTMEELPAEFEGDDLALAYVNEVTQNARAKLEQLELGELLAPAEAENGG